jgi:hypothetical protein
MTTASSNNEKPRILRVIGQQPGAGRCEKNAGIDARSFIESSSHRVIE